MTKAVIVVDVQRDFVEGGSLEVIGGLMVAYRIANFMITAADSAYDYIVATKDFHLGGGHTNGGHFADEPDFKGTWPVHCVEGEDGSLFARPIEAVADKFDAVFYKGQGEPAYSGFQGKTMDGVSLDYWLAEREVDTLDIMGIATDYCVLHTAFDAQRFGYKVRVPVNMTAAVGGEVALKRSIEEINHNGNNVVGRKLMIN